MESVVIVSLGFGISGLVVRLALVTFLVVQLLVGTLLLVLLHFEIFLLVVELRVGTSSFRSASEQREDWTSLDTPLDPKAR